MKTKPTLLRTANFRTHWTANLLHPFRILADLLTGTVKRNRKLNSDWEFHALVDHASVGVALESMEGEIFYVNPAFCRMLGYEEEELRRMRCSEFTHPEDEKTEMALFEQLREGRRLDYQVDKRFRHKNKEWVWARVSISLLKTGTAGPSLVVGVVEDIKERRVAEEEVKRSKLELEQLARHLLHAQEEERLRISRELHDEIGQRMVLMSMEIERLEEDLRAGSAAALAEKAADLNAHLEELASSIHDMCRDLHSSKLDLLGLRAALHELCGKIFRHGGIDVRLEVDEDADRLPEEVARCFYRVAQEALNNVSKHSGAQSAQVFARREGAVVRLTIRDFGKGFDSSILRDSTRMGLASMRERLRSVGGTLCIRSSPGQGTEVTAELRCMAIRLRGQGVVAER
jgi:two-component system, NarL family, sensor histidine kinase UhpB